MPQSGLVRAAPADRLQRSGVFSDRATSSREFPAAWNVLALAPSILSGTYQWGVPGINISSFANAAGINATVVYTPCVFYAPWTADLIACEVTTAAASTNLRMFAYAMGRDGQPTGPPLFDTGDISSATTGTKSAVIAAYGPAGKYLLGVVASGAVSVRSGQITNWPTEFNPGTFGGGANILRQVRSASMTYGAAPTPGVPYGYSGDSSTLTASNPILAMRWRH